MYRIEWDSSPNFDSSSRDYGVTSIQETYEVQQVITSYRSAGAGGTFSLSWGGRKTSALPFDCSEAEMTDALAIITDTSNVADDPVKVTRDELALGYTWKITFLHNRGDLAPLVADGRQLTGDSPRIRVVELVQGFSDLAIGDFTTKSRKCSLMDASALEMQAALQVTTSSYSIKVTKTVRNAALNSAIWSVTFAYLRGEEMVGAGNIFTMTVASSQLTGTNAVVRVANKVTGSDPSRFTVTDLRPGVKYFAHVMAYNADGFGSANSPLASAVTCSQPPAPQSVTASVVDGTTLQVDWSASTASELCSVDKYKVEWYRAEGTQEQQTITTSAGKGIPEIQRLVNFADSQTLSGYFKLSFGGEMTENIRWDAAAIGLNSVKERLERLSTVGTVDVFKADSTRVVGGLLVTATSMTVTVHGTSTSTIGDSKLAQGDVIWIAGNKRTIMAAVSVTDTTLTIDTALEITVPVPVFKRAYGYEWKITFLAGHVGPQELVQTALESLVTIGAVNVTRSANGYGYNWVITFISEFKNDISLLSVDGTELQGPGPKILAARTLNGVQPAWYCERNGATDIPVETGVPGQLRYVIPGLKTGEKYAIHVRAHNREGYGYAGSISPTFQIPRTTPSSPQAVELLSLSSRLLKLRWDIPLSNGGASITSYQVQWDTSVDFTNPMKVDVLVSSTDTAPFYYNIPVTSVMKYYVRVFAVNNQGDGAFAVPSPSSITPMDRTPGRPEDATAKVLSSYAILVEWKPSSTEKIYYGGDGGLPTTQYMVEWDNSPGFDSPPAFGLVDGTKRSYIIGGDDAITGVRSDKLVAGSAYSIRVTAFNAKGAGAPRSTTPASVTVTDQPPSSPQNLKLSVVTSTSVKAEWMNPLYDGGESLKSYQIEWDEQDDFSSGQSSSATISIIREMQSIELQNDVVNEEQFVDATVKVTNEEQVVRTTFTGLDEVQLITTTNSVVVDEVQTVVTSATDRNEVQELRLDGDDVDEIQAIRTSVPEVLQVQTLKVVVARTSEVQTITLTLPGAFATPATSIGGTIYFSFDSSICTHCVKKMYQRTINLVSSLQDNTATSAALTVKNALNDLANIDTVDVTRTQNPTGPDLTYVYTIVFSGMEVAGNVPTIGIDAAVTVGGNAVSGIPTQAAQITAGSEVDYASSAIFTVTYTCESYSDPYAITTFSTACTPSASDRICAGCVTSFLGGIFTVAQDLRTNTYVVTGAKLIAGVCSFEAGTVIKNPTSTTIAIATNDVGLYCSEFSGKTLDLYKTPQTSRDIPLKTTATTISSASVVEAIWHDTVAVVYSGGNCNVYGYSRVTGSMIIGTFQIGLVREADAMQTLVVPTPQYTGNIPWDVSEADMKSILETVTQNSKKVFGTVTVKRTVYSPTGNKWSGGFTWQITFTTRGGNIPKMVTRTVVGATTTLTTPTNGAPTADVEDATHPLNPFANSRDGNQVMGTMMLKFRDVAATLPCTIGVDTSLATLDTSVRDTLLESFIVTNLKIPSIEIMRSAATQAMGFTWTISFSDASTGGDIGLLQIVSSQLTGKNIRLGVYETVKGNQLGGNFQLSFNGETTAPIAFNAEASEVETELNKLGTIKPSSVVVSRGNPTLAQVLGYTWYITFRSSKWADPTSDHSKGIDGNWKSSSPASWDDVWESGYSKAWGRHVGHTFLLKCITDGLTTTASDGSQNCVPSVSTTGVGPIKGFFTVSMDSRLAMYTHLAVNSLVTSGNIAHNAWATKEQSGYTGTSVEEILEKMDNVGDVAVSRGDVDKATGGYTWTVTFLRDASDATHPCEQLEESAGSLLCNAPGNIPQMAPTSTSLTGTSSLASVATVKDGTILRGDFTDFRVQGDAGVAARYFVSLVCTNAPGAVAPAATSCSVSSLTIKADGDLLQKQLLPQDRITVGTFPNCIFTVTGVSTVTVSVTATTCSDMDTSNTGATTWLGLSMLLPWNADENLVERQLEAAATISGRQVSVKRTVHGKYGEMSWLIRFISNPTFTPPGAGDLPDITTTFAAEAGSSKYDVTVTQVTPGSKGLSGSFLLDFHSSSLGPREIFFDEDPDRLQHKLNEMDTIGRVTVKRFKYPSSATGCTDSSCSGGWEDIPVKNPGTRGGYRWRIRFMQATGDYKGYTFPPGSGDVASLSVSWSLLMGTGVSVDVYTNVPGSSPSTGAFAFNTSERQTPALPYSTSAEEMKLGIEATDLFGEVDVTQGYLLTQKIPGATATLTQDGITATITGVDDIRQYIAPTDIIRFGSSSANNLIGTNGDAPFTGVVDTSRVRVTARSPVVASNVDSTRLLYPGMQLRIDGLVYKVQRTGHEVQTLTATKPSSTWSTAYVANAFQLEMTRNGVTKPPTNCLRFNEDAATVQAAIFGLMFAFDITATTDDVLVSRWGTSRVLGDVPQLAVGNIGTGICSSGAQDGVYPALMVETIRQGAPGFTYDIFFMDYRTAPIVNLMSLKSKDNGDNVCVDGWQQNGGSVRKATVTGSYAITFGGQTSPCLLYTASASDVASAIKTVTSSAVGDILVSLDKDLLFSPNRAIYRITFVGELVTGNLPVIGVVQNSDTACANTVATTNIIVEGAVDGGSSSGEFALTTAYDGENPNSPHVAFSVSQQFSVMDEQFEIQQLVVSNPSNNFVAGETYTLKVLGTNTNPIPWDVSETALQLQLTNTVQIALTPTVVGANDIIVTRRTNADLAPHGFIYAIYFSGASVTGNIAAITVVAATGAHITQSNVVVSTVRQGVAGISTLSANSIPLALPDDSTSASRYQSSVVESKLEVYKVNGFLWTIKFKSSLGNIPKLGKKTSSLLGGTMTIQDDFVPGSSSNTYAISNLLSGIPYYAHVAAWTDIGIGSFSSSVSIIPSSKASGVQHLAAGYALYEREVQEIRLAASHVMEIQEISTNAARVAEVQTLRTFVPPASCPGAASAVKTELTSVVNGAIATNDVVVTRDGDASVDFQYGYVFQITFVGNNVAGETKKIVCDDKTFVATGGVTVHCDVAMDTDVAMGTDTAVQQVIVSAKKPLSVGSYKIHFNYLGMDKVSGCIPFDASAKTMESSLEAMPNIDNVYVTRETDVVRHEWVRLHCFFHGNGVYGDTPLMVWLVTDTGCTPFQTVKNNALTTVDVDGKVEIKMLDWGGFNAANTFVNAATATAAQLTTDLNRLPVFGNVLVSQSIVDEQGGYIWTVAFKTRKGIYRNLSALWIQIPSSPIPFNADADTVKAALEAMPRIGTVQVKQSDPSPQFGYTWTISFLDFKGDVPMLRVTSLLVGTGSQISVREVRKGNALGGAFTLAYANAVTTPINWNAAAIAALNPDGSSMQEKLEALDVVGKVMLFEQDLTKREAQDPHDRNIFLVVPRLNTGTFTAGAATTIAGLETALEALTSVGSVDVSSVKTVLEVGAEVLITFTAQPGDLPPLKPSNNVASVEETQAGRTNFRKEVVVFSCTATQDTVRFTYNGEHADVDFNAALDTVETSLLTLFGVEAESISVTSATQLGVDAGADAVIVFNTDASIDGVYNNDPALTMSGTFQVGYQGLYTRPLNAESSADQLRYALEDLDSIQTVSVTRELSYQPLLDGIVQVSGSACDKCYYLPTQTSKKLTMGQLYCIEVYAYNYNDKGAAPVDGLISATPSQVPASPSNVNLAVISGKEIEVFFSPPPLATTNVSPNLNNDISSYIVQWDLNVAFKHGRQICANCATQLNGMTLSVSISLSNFLIQNSKFTFADDSCVLTADIVGPTSIQLQSGHGCANFNGQTYPLYYYSYPPQVLSGSAIQGSPPFRFVIPNLVSGKTYYVRVAAVNSVPVQQISLSGEPPDNRQWSYQLSATTADKVPDPPLSVYLNPFSSTTLEIQIQPSTRDGKGSGGTGITAFWIDVDTVSTFDSVGKRAPVEVLENSGSIPELYSGGPPEMDDTTDFCPFTLSFGGLTTAALPMDISAGNLRFALMSLASLTNVPIRHIEVCRVAVNIVQGYQWIVTFSDTNKNAGNQPLIQYSQGTITGGSGVAGRSFDVQSGIAVPATHSFPGKQEVQVLVAYHTSTVAGYFRLSYKGSAWTNYLSATVSAADLKLALEALPTIGVVTVNLETMLLNGDNAVDTTGLLCLPDGTTGCSGSWPAAVKNLNQQAAPTKTIAQLSTPGEVAVDYGYYETLDASTTTYTIPGLTSGNSYLVTVSAKNSQGFGARTQSSPMIVTPPVQVPGPPVNVSVDVNPGYSTQLMASWEAPEVMVEVQSGSRDINLACTGVGCTGTYDVLLPSKSRAGSKPSTCTGSHVIPTSGVLNKGQLYYVRVFAYNQIGFGDPQLAVSPQKPMVVPGAPTGVTLAVLTVSELVVLFNLPDDNGGDTVTGYEVQWATDTAFTSPSSALVQLTTGMSSPSWTIPSFFANFAATVYDAKLTDSSGVRDHEFDHVNGGVGSPLDDGGDVVSGYIVQWDVVSTFDSLAAGSTTAVINDATQRAYTITLLTPGTRYYVRVFTKNLGGKGTPQTSTPASMVPATTRPGKPNSLAAAATATIGQLQVVWQPPRVPAHGIPCAGTLQAPQSCPILGGLDMVFGGVSLESYLVQYADSSDFSLAKEVSVTTTSAIISGLESGKTYYVRVLTVNSQGLNSDFCMRANAQGLLCPGHLVLEDGSVVTGDFVFTAPK
ncbi:Immunoglobulin-like fold [Phytophthora cactorum]|nr:Immunoglobulin-like fold [Phytophthora cactorum]